MAILPPPCTHMDGSLAPASEPQASGSKAWRRLRALHRQLGAAAAGAAAASPFLPEPALAGGLVLPLWPEDSPFLDRARIHLPEENLGPDATITSIRGVHNPSMEVHLSSTAATATGAAVLLVPGGGHNQLGIANCVKLVPFFNQLGVAAVIVRPRLRIDGCTCPTPTMRPCRTWQPPSTPPQ
jgi:hypothetical protein